jgi:prevent-host-death family protein
VILKASAELAKLANMKYVNTHEAKTQLSKLIAAARAGEEVVICQAGKPVARLAPYEPARKKPRLGAGKDKVTLYPGWDSPETDAEIEAMFDVLKESDDS